MATRYLRNFDVKGSGNYVNEEAGETLPSHNLVYRNAAGTWSLADADTVATMPVIGITMGAIGTGKKGEILLEGNIGDTAWAWTAGGEVYASDTAGELTQTAGTVVQEVGVAISATMLYFNPQNVSVGAAAGCALLEGATAYVGFDSCKEPFTNYFLCDGTADDVQIQAAIDYMAALGGGKACLEAGTYNLSNEILVTTDQIHISGVGRATLLLLDDNIQTNVIHVEVDAGATAILGFYLSDIKIDGNFVNNADAGSDFLQNGVYARNMQIGYIRNVIIVNNRRHGLLIRAGQFNEFTDIKSVDNVIHQIRLQAGSMYMAFTNCYGAAHNGLDGWYIWASSNIALSSCYAVDCGASGFRIVTSSYITLAGCISATNQQHGFEVDGSYMIFSGCISNGNALDAANTYDGFYLDDTTYTQIVNCTVHSTTNRYRYGINEDGTSDNNRIQANTIRGYTTGAAKIIGASTKLAAKPFQFTGTVNGEVVYTAPAGVDVDATTEEAVVWGQIPVEVQQVVRLKIWGVATDAPIGAGGQMHLEITFNAGASNLPYNTGSKSWNIANFDGEEVDYVADDIVHWVIVDADVGNELLALAAGDSFELRAIWEVGDDPDGATDCLFRVVEVEYV